MPLSTVGQILGRVATAAAEGTGAGQPAPGAGEFATAWLVISHYVLPALTVIAILLIAFGLAKWASQVVTTAARGAKIDDTIAIFFGKITKYAIIGVAVVMCLSRFGISTASLAALLAAAGFAIGLAFQGTLANFSAGIVLLVFRPFKVGDYIEAAGHAGFVREIDLFTTAIDTFDNRRIVLPNAMIAGDVIDNASFHESRRCDVTVGVHYKEDVRRTRQVLFEALQTVANRDPDRDPIVVLKDLGPSSVDWHLRVWTTPEHYWQVRESMLEATKIALDRAGLVIPFPQLDVHLDRLEPSPAAADQAAPACPA